VWLILGHGQDDLHGPDDPAGIAVFGHEHNPFARAALSNTPRQNATASSRGSGAMKLTDAPPSTQSTSTSASASTRAGPASAFRIRNPSVTRALLRRKNPCKPWGVW
jgi:hypothetical protein